MFYIRIRGGVGVTRDLSDGSSYEYKFKYLLKQCLVVCVFGCFASGIICRTVCCLCASTEFLFVCFYFWAVTIKI